MSKLYAQNKYAVPSSSIAFAGSGGGSSRRQTLGPGGGSDPGNQGTQHGVDAGGLRTKTSEEKNRVALNAVTTVAGGAAAFGATTAIRGVGAVASIITSWK